MCVATRLRLRTFISSFARETNEEENEYCLLTCLLSSAIELYNELASSYLITYLERARHASDVVRSDGSPSGCSCVL